MPVTPVGWGRVRQGQEGGYRDAPSSVGSGVIHMSPWSENGTLLYVKV